MGEGCSFYRQVGIFLWRTAFSVFVKRCQVEKKTWIQWHRNEPDKNAQPALFIEDMNKFCGEGLNNRLQGLSNIRSPNILKNIKTVTTKKSNGMYYNFISGKTAPVMVFPLECANNGSCQWCLKSSKIFEDLRKFLVKTIIFYTQKVDV